MPTDSVGPDFLGIQDLYHVPTMWQTTTGTIFFSNIFFVLVSQVPLAMPRLANRVDFKDILGLILAVWERPVRLIQAMFRPHARQRLDGETANRKGFSNYSPEN